MKKNFQMNTIKDCFDFVSFQNGDRKAITFFREGTREIEISYGLLNRYSNQMAHRFIDKGVLFGKIINIHNSPSRHSKNRGHNRPLKPWI